MTRLSLLILPITVLCACTSSTSTRGERVKPSSPPPVRYEWGLPVDSFHIDTATIRNGETLGGIINRLGASRQQQAAVATMSRQVFDYRQLREGQTYYALYQPDTTGTERLCYFVLQNDIRTATLLNLGDSLYSTTFQKPLITRSRQASVTITSSLWNAMTSNDLPVELALELSDIYAWTIDFFALQQGDSIHVFYDEQYVDSTRIGIGTIYAANFYHGRTWLPAYRFDYENTHNYFDAKGESLRKAFLKAPLNYKRISSKFTYARKHPIYRVVRPHTGVDYAAPAGTPVVAIGDGTVTFKQFKGGGGNTIKIRHNSTYTTAYLHLKGYAKGLKVGDHVHQGQVIGYVGSTGSSTGPHLDFRVWKNGSPIDPLKMVSPPAEPVPAAQKDSFMRLVSELDQHI